MSVTWTNELELKFLEYFQAEPVLWNTNFKDYKNKLKNHDAWNRLSALMEVPIDELKNKKTSLFASYRGYRNKIKKSENSGAGVDEVYKPIWFAYEIMDNFLGDTTKCKKTINSVFKTPTTSSNRPLSKKRKANDHATYMKKFMNVCTNALSQKEEVDEFMAIAINIAAKLKKMTSEQAYLSESLITQIITKGLFSKLTHNTIVTERAGNSHPDDSRCASHDSRTASYEDSHDSSSTTCNN